MLGDYIHGKSASSPDVTDEGIDCCSHCGKNLLPISEWIEIEKNLERKKFKINIPSNVTTGHSGVCLNGEKLIAGMKYRNILF